MRRGYARAVLSCLVTVCLISSAPLYAEDGIAQERRAYRLCLARAATAIEDRFSPPADVIAAVKPYCTKEQAALFVMAAFGSGAREIASADAWGTSYVVAIRSCLSGTCALLEAMQRNDLGL